jgi:predicted Rossmann fold nucleotide-binding protein DprA/Smf involved in DNA uptake
MTTEWEKLREQIENWLYEELGIEELLRHGFGNETLEDKKEWAEKYTNQLVTLIKSSFPSLAKEMGYFQEEAEWIGELIEKGWIPPPKQVGGK